MSDTHAAPPADRMSPVPVRPALTGAPLVAAACLAVVLALLAAGLVGYNLAGGDTPTDDSPEAGFARDMQTHHAQAVQMSLTVREQSTDPVLRGVAYDITTSQQQQIGQMYAWLRLWGLPQTSSQPPLAWMPTADHLTAGDPHSSGPGAAAARMPGMATPGQLDDLAAATGRDAEILYLRLMIPHHRAGIAMAQAITDQTDRPEIEELAGAIGTAQRAEIEQLQRLLADRGAGP